MRFNSTSWKAVHALLILVGLASSAGAAELGLEGWDLRAGVALPSDWDQGTTFGVSLDLGRLTSGLYLYPAVRYSSAKATESIFGFDFDLNVKDTAVGAEVRYFPAHERKGWYFGGGGYMHFLDYDVAAGGGKASATTQEVGPGGVAGYRWAREKTSFFVEARYDLAGTFDRGEVLVGVAFGGRNEE